MKEWYEGGWGRPADSAAGRDVSDGCVVLAGGIWCEYDAPWARFGAIVIAGRGDGRQEAERGGVKDDSEVPPLLSLPLY